MKKVNILSGLFALPVLLVVAAVLIVVTLVLAAFHSALRRKLYGHIYLERKSKLRMNTN
ncbi:hypothetical protein [Paenibacillus sp. NPDC057934]|uniref:hypothetical protein n=1 Tax=Paenibacillus sp. NPDC057934 TaxID=3346282 RepID=UPI0036D8E29A